ncbi:carbohydrate esterase family 9 protein [Mycena rebaudengoi]|nr:carbohydrate esterase family 9 protein [Mycena rebaudengoi]
MEKPSGYYPVPQKQPRNRVKIVRLGVLVFALCSYSLTFLLWPNSPRIETLPINAAEIVNKCRSLHLTPGPPDDFHTRTQSDRFVEGTKATLIRNASIWTGLDSGNEVVLWGPAFGQGDHPEDLVILDAAGAWVSPGIIDLHSHLGVLSTPVLRGAADGNSLAGLVLPWMRSLDGLNTHDDAYRLSISGGVTTANVLPGSADAIGGQAFVIKLRPTAERSSSAMLLEPPFSLNGTYVDPSARPRWRQMKHACGRIYSGTRMDTQWAFRQGYNTARLIKEKQDAYCAKAVAGQWKDLGDFPEDLQWEALVDVLRGRVKVHNHCYEGVDIDGMVRLTNEFKFSIAAFHHAHEAYLVPDLIKKAYGHPPAVAIFATNGRYKREAYRGSEFAPRILADSGLDVVMKSDHPILNSQYLLFEAQQAHYFGLSANLALASVTSTPARVMGQDHRIGRLIEGFDADSTCLIITPRQVWDSHPLSLGAAPTQVFIDGIAQLENPHTVEKPKSSQRVPATPDFEKEIADAIKYEGLPPLEPETFTSDIVVFRNVGSILLKDSKRRISEVFTSAASEGVVVVEKGKIICRGEQVATARHIDLEGGSISCASSPSFQLGAYTYSFFLQAWYSPPTEAHWAFLILLQKVIKAADGLLFATRDALLAYRSGVTTVFSTVAAHKLVDGAVLQDVAALHVALSLNFEISLRGLLLGGGHSELAQRFGDVAAGKIPLVVYVESADVIASVLSLKKEVETAKGRPIQITLTGATEAHLLAKEIGKAGVGVIVQQRPFPFTWQQRRILPGPPLTKSSAIAKLIAYNVTVGVGIDEVWAARNARFDAAWAGLESDGVLNKAQTLALASSNLETLLGVKNIDTDLVAIRGGSDFEGKVIAVISDRRGSIDIL